MTTPHRNRRSIVTVTVAVASLIMAGCSADDISGTNAVAVGGTFQFHSPGGETVITYDEGERAPIADITGPSLRDTSDTVKLSDYPDSVVVINAWGQWCGPCRTEVDDIQVVHEHLEKTGGTVIGINVRDTEALAQDFVKDNGLTYPSIFDPPFKLAAQLGGVPASVVPTTIVLDKQHRPAAVFLKETTADELLDVIEPLEQVAS